jgi:phosphoadenosine phosphosulfate reductase
MSASLTSLLRADLAGIARDFAPAALASSFGAEDMVLVDIVAREFPSIAVFTIDTGRLPRETIELRREVESRYGIRVAVYEPRPEAVWEWIAAHGENGFYDSLENRRECCAIRKVEPLGRALRGLKGWITGLRREQSPTRAALPKHEFDAGHDIFKFNPLADWTEPEVREYLDRHRVPVNALHARGYPSIGCAPCTRAVRPGEDPRAGRWWWEQRDTKECGLHLPSATGPSRRAEAAR